MFVPSFRNRKSSGFLVIDYYVLLGNTSKHKAPDILFILNNLVHSGIDSALYYTFSPHYAHALVPTTTSCWFCCCCCCCCCCPLECLGGFSFRSRQIGRRHKVIRFLGGKSFEVSALVDDAESRGWVEGKSCVTNRQRWTPCCGPHPSKKLGKSS